MFEWNARKADANAEKHGVTFDEAATVFVDPDGLDAPDTGHSQYEPRFLRLGRSEAGRLLMLVYTTRSQGDAEVIRLISARRASRAERRAYAARD